MAVTLGLTFTFWLTIVMLGAVTLVRRAGAGTGTIAIAAAANSFLKKQDDRHIDRYLACLTSPIFADRA